MAKKGSEPRGMNAREDGFQDCLDQATGAVDLYEAMK